MKIIIKLLKEKWYLYLLSLIVTTILLTWLFSFFPDVKRKEIINVYIMCYGINEDEISNYFNSNKPDEIKQVHTSFTNENSLYSEYSFQTKGILDSDVLILPYSLIEGYELNNYFVSIDSTLNGYNYLVKDEVNYGITLYDYVSHNSYLDDYILYGLSFENNEQNYYLFINLKVANIDKTIEFIKNILKDNEN